MRKEEQAYVDTIDTGYSYGFAKSIEQFKTNEVLGYRTSGSKAEWQTGELIRQEMESIGLQAVHKDEIRVDTWEFKQAVMQYRDMAGQLHEFQLGAYQTDFHTDGWKEYDLVDVKKGRACDYQGLDVKGKLVLARINQREEWWINFPVYEAWLKGAAALIAIQEGGFSEIDETALNAQDIGGPSQAPAFSMSWADAGVLEPQLRSQGTAKVFFCADSTVKKDGITWNITGEIPGRDTETMVLISSHYDSYFSGFQDDNAAVGMMLGIGKALLDSGYRPQRTLLFCAMAAEEWGQADSKYDWSIGAYRQVFEVHPEWQGRIVADINFELPALRHSQKDAVRCVSEYVDFIRRFLRKVQPDKAIYPKGITVRYPIQTMSDDFSMAIAGIPSMVNEFTSGLFMETHYHSQFDNETYYEEPVYQYHHELYGRLVMAFDRTLLPPFCFRTLFESIEDSIDMKFCEGTEAKGERLWELAEAAIAVGDQIYQRIRQENECYEACLEQGREEEAAAMRSGSRKAYGILMGCFRKAQDSFVRLNWHDEVLFPQEAVRENLRHIKRAIVCLEEGYVTGALEAVYQIDNNRYAFLFDEEVFRYFTDYVLAQEPGRLQWGAGRIMHHENLYSLVKQLESKYAGSTDLTEELALLRRVEAGQLAYYCDDVDYMIHAVQKITNGLAEVSRVLL